MSFNRFSDVLPSCTCARPIGNLLSICLGLNILSPFLCVCFNENISLLKASRVNSRTLKRAFTLS